MIRIHSFRLTAVAVILLFGVLVTRASLGCTTAVISGKVTHDGRPILWKNRDTSFRHNELVLFEDGKYRMLAVVNAGSRKSVWMGVNETGFCIENSLSKDLNDESGEKESSSKTGMGNGGLMKLALQTCASVEDFRKLLEKTDADGRRTNANFGVIDATGGAAMFEVGPASHVMFDANDGETAPHGYLVRANFATTVKGVPPSPDPQQLDDIYSSQRFAQACALLEPLRKDGINVSYILRNMSRDLSGPDGKPYPGTVNGLEGKIPSVILTDSTISRTTTVSAAVFHGVRDGEDPANTTMWTFLGDPKFSIAVPCWVNVNEVNGALIDPRGGELGEIAITLREWCLNQERNGIRTEYLPGIWNDLWPVEDQILSEVAKHVGHWRREGASRNEMTALHLQLTQLAMNAMQNELIEMKQNALALQSPRPPVFKLTRVAVYDHSGGVANGPKDLMRILAAENGFHCQRISPTEIRNGQLRDFDALVMPGGSGSLQAKKLEETGCAEVREFVRKGGGYVGICAGSYLASSHYDWSLDLINARVWDRSHWARGQGTVKLGITSPGQQVLQVDSTNVEVYYGQGPLLVPDNDPELPGYEVLARYETEVAEKGAQSGAMSGTHAIIRSVFGDGRVICFSPHPEKSNGPNGLMLHGVRWAAGDGHSREDSKKTEQQKSAATQEISANQEISAKQESSAKQQLSDQ